MSSNNVRPLPAVPTTSVSASTLPAPIGVEQQSLDDIAGVDGEDPLLQPTDDVASLEASTLQPPDGGGAEVTEDDLIGVWTAATPSATCSLNLSLTSWQGGFRASTRNCADIQVSTLSAWALEGNQVQLKGTDGATLARLFRTGPARYAGQLETGEAVTLFR